MLCRVFFGQCVFQRIGKFFGFSLFSHTVIYILGVQYNKDFIVCQEKRALRPFLYQLVFFLATTTFWTDVVFVQVFKHAVYGFVMNMTTYCTHVLLHGGLLTVPLCERPGPW